MTHSSGTSSASGLGLPAVAAQAAIVLGFLLGTWMLLDGLHFCITGRYLNLAATRPLGPATLMAILSIAFGALWMIIPNLLLFQNRPAPWKAMLVLIVASSWYVGAATPLLVAMLLLLLLPATRRRLR